MLSAPLSFGGSAEGMISRVNFDGEEELSAEAALLFFRYNGTVCPFLREWTVGRNSRITVRIQKGLSETCQTAPPFRGRLLADADASRMGEAP